MARLLYTLLLLCIAPFVPVYLLWRARRQPDYLRHWAERGGCYARTLRPPENTKTFWLHAVSVGETRATQPLVQHIRQRWPEHHILITHMTPTGRQTSLELYGDADARITRVYLPYDFPWAMRRFLRHFRPRLGILMETELWPNLIAECHAQRIPLILANARLSEKSARNYARFPQLTRETLSHLAAILAQTAEDAERLTQLGATARTLHIVGNVKFDITPPAEMLSRGQTWRHTWRTWSGKQRVLLAASTREGEEALILDAYQNHLTPDFLLVIVPRHPQRFAEVTALSTARGLHTTQRSVSLDISSKTQVLIGDSMGELFAYYAAADIAFIGGSLLDYGCQNLIEACAVGVPVLIGPSTYNFAEAARAALACGAAQQIDNADALFRRAAASLTTSLTAPHEPAASAGAVFAAAHRGASARTFTQIAAFIDD
ncbi:MAG: lipid IV(A) 3-deoxy-D-manno-octulosonic acid transferase [Sterolibacterium sp.]|jgi:3-deoxy-D-manno-octulosonic-acid transferase|nr:lipid IV(A) 3-deoxy-D-manno-octulosonic acid transferase [Sterolibacterium sp.]